MAAEEEELLTNEDSKVLLSLDSDDTFPDDFVQLEYNSTWDSSREATLGDGQGRIHAGNENPVAVNRGGSVDFDLKLLREEPYPEDDIQEGTIMRLGRVHSNGKYELLRVVVQTVRESTPANGLPTWQGTARRKGPRETGTLSPWPPV